MKRNILIYALIMFMLMVLGCSSVNPPSSPDIDLHHDSISENSHKLWGFYDIIIDLDKFDYEITPVRAASTHWNILGWLETWPCTDCLRIDSITHQPDGTVDAVLTIIHPFASPNLTGFDVRGIVMFSGFEHFPEADLSYSRADYYSPELLNADGFTTLYNPDTEGEGPGGLQGYIQGKLTPYHVDVGLSGYKRYISQDPSNTRNAFFAGDEISQTFHIQKPTGSLVMFSYAVDSCWVKADNIPVTDPMTDFPLAANCEEPWKIHTVVEDIGDGLTPYGGSVNIEIHVFDHTGMDSHNAPVLECTELFNGTVEADFVEDYGDYSVWQTTISNEKLALNGSYYCLVSVEDHENDPVLAPWLDLTAYQIIKLVVSGEYTITDVTPPGLQDTLDYCEDVFVSNGYAYVTGEFPYLYIVDISVPEEAFIAASWPTTSITATVVVEGNIAYLTANYDDSFAFDMIILDVTDPTSPSLISNHAPSGAPHGVSGDIAVSSAGMLGFMLHDINPLESAHYVKHVELSDYDWMADILVLDGYAYALRGHVIHIVDFDPIETAAQIGSETIPNAPVWKMDDWNNYLFVAGLTGIDIFDITDPGSPSYLTFFEIDEQASGIQVENGIAFITFYGTIELWDVDPPTEAELIGHGPAPSCSRFAVDGNYIYLTRDWTFAKPFRILRFE